MALFILLIFLVLIISPIIALIALSRAGRVERRLEESAGDLRRQIDAITQYLAARHDAAQTAPHTAAQPATQTTPQPASETAAPPASVPPPTPAIAAATLTSLAPTPATPTPSTLTPSTLTPSTLTPAAVTSSSLTVSEPAAASAPTIVTGPLVVDPDADAALARTVPPPIPAEPVPLTPLPPTPLPPTPLPHVAAAAASMSAADAPSAAKPGPASGPAPGPAPAPAPPPTPVPPAAPPFWQNIDWEGIVGVKLFSAIAGIALALAGVFFLKFSIDHGWLQPPVRAALGILTSTALLLLCEQKFARRYRLTANALDGGALAILFATFFAAHTLWHLIGTLPTFALLGLVTALAVFLSVRRDSLFIAVLGLLGGFATPALLGSGHDNPIGLFGYLLLLNAGLSWIAYMKRWPVLTALSLVITASYQWAWVLRFLTVQKLPLAAGIFLVFPILSFAALVLSRRAPGSRRRGEGDDDRAGDDEPEESAPWLMRFGPTTAISAALPLLLATYLAAVPEFGAQYWLLFGFLGCLAAGLFAVAMLRAFYVLHYVGAVSAVLVTAVWLGVSYTPAAWPDVLGIFAIFILFYLGAPVLATRLGRELGEPATRAHLASSFFFAFFALFARLEPGRDALPLLFGTLFVLLAITGGYAILRGAGLVYFVAAFFAVAAEAVWSTRYLTADRLVPALVLYASFGLLYLGIPELARRLQRPLRPEGAGGWLLIASLGLLFFLADARVASSSLWGIGLLLAILNAGLFVESLATRQLWLSFVGIGLSWLVLVTWWLTVPLAPVLVPALTVLVGYALLVFAGTHWMVRRAAAAAPLEPFDAHTPALAFVVYLFLAALATRPSLALPPWPIFAALAVLALAIVVAGLRQGRGALHLTGTISAAVVLLIWTGMAVSVVRSTGLTVPIPAGPIPLTPIELAADAAAVAWTATSWAMVSVGAVLALLACAGVTLAIAERRRVADASFAAAVVAAAMLGQVILLFDGAPPAGRGLTWLVAPGHVLCIVAILIVAWRRRWFKLPLYGVGLSAVLLFLNLAPLDPQRLAVPHLWYAAAICVCYVVYPVVLGRRARTALEPYLAAVLASGLFFFLARFDLINAGYASIIALLPVTQALIMGGLVLLLLRIEPPGSRTLGRLALVAGTALAFVTVAIPLQFDKEWLTLGWALETAALAWLYRRLPHRGLLIAAAALAVVVFVRLSANPDVFLYAPRSDRPILNWYLYTYLVASASFFAAARLLLPTQDRLVAWLPRLSTLLPAGATILLFDLLNIEIADVFSTGPTLSFRFSATLAQDLTYTLGWLVFGVALLAAGIVKGSRAARIASLGLLVVTVLKCFLHDLGRLGGLYRVGAFVGLAICLTLVAVALQRFVLTGPSGRATTPDGPAAD